jgi:heptosyltransferase-2
MLAAHLRLAAGAVGNDSGLTHLAVAVGVPAVVLFGPTVPEFGFTPAGPHRVVERSDLACRPCAVHGGSRCPRQDHACLSELEVGRVLDALATLGVLAAASPPVGTAGAKRPALGEDTGPVPTS